MAQATLQRITARVTTTTPSKMMPTGASTTFVQRPTMTPMTTTTSTPAPATMTVMSTRPRPSWGCRARGAPLPEGARPVVGAPVPLRLAVPELAVAMHPVLSTLAAVLATVAPCRQTMARELELELGPGIPGVADRGAGHRQALRVAPRE